MPHQRKRDLLSVLEKRLTLFPVVGVLGARQTGKSTLIRDFLPKLRTVHYVTLDRSEIQQEAIIRPSFFIKNLESSKIQTVCIDEVQKAPPLFDTIKAEVDEQRRPGRFALSGSSEFSKKTGIQESLTGRIVLLRIFPLNLSEIRGDVPSFPLLNPSKEKDPSVGENHFKEIYQWLERGGMPGIFAIREDSNREALFDAWIETTCTRDLAAFKIPGFNPDLARRILIAIAHALNPNRTEIAKAVGRDPRKIDSYLEAFKALFVIYEIEPHSSGVGKSLFYIFDAGIAAYLGATEKRRLQIWFLNECFSQFSYSGSSRPDVFYYVSTKNSRIDFIVQTKKSTYAVLLVEEESPSIYTLRGARAFQVKNPDCPIFVLAPCLYRKKIEKNITIIPYCLAY